MLRNAIAAALLVGVSACASPTENTGASDSARDCFRTIDVRGYGVVDERRIRATVSSSREYVLTLSENPRDLDWTQEIALRSTTSFICVGNGLGVEVTGGDPPRTYHVTRVERAPDDTPTGS
jgi:hypothetical protein